MPQDRIRDTLVDALTQTRALVQNWNAFAGHLRPADEVYGPVARFYLALRQIEQDLITHPVVEKTLKVKY